MGVSSPARNPSIEVPSFFKIMIDDKFSEVMILPPKFAKTVSNLISQKFQLEDASGRIWTVTLSKYNRSLAFQKGWHDFAVEHGLEIGEFLVFNCLNYDHLLVTIYGRCGCEKIPRTGYGENKRKRKRTNENSKGKNKHFRETDSDNVNGQYSNTSAVSLSNIEVSPIAMDNTSNTDDGNNHKVFSKTNCSEEPFYMINRDTGVRQCEPMDSLFDLASFEMRDCDVLESRKRVLENEKPHEENATIPNMKIEVSRVEKVPVSGKVQSCQAIPEVPKMQNTQKSKYGRPQNESTITKNVSESNVASVRAQCGNPSSGKEQVSVSQKQHTPVRMSEQSSIKNIFGGLDFSGLPKSVRPEVYSSVSQKQYTPLRMSDQSSKKFAAGLDFSGLPKSVKPEIYSSGEEHFSVPQKHCTPLSMSDQSSKKFAAGIDFSGLPKSVKPKIYSCGKSSKFVKQEQIEMNAGKGLQAVKQEQVEMKEGHYVHGGIPGYQWIMKLDESYYPPYEVNNHVDPVKAEPVEIYDIESNVVVKIPVSEALMKQPYIELPDRLFPISSKIKQTPERKVVVYLRGPVSSTLMWPVLYYERLGRKVLTNGWETFKNANGIGPGDECVIGAEDSKEHIFRVTVNK